MKIDCAKRKGQEMKMEKELQTALAEYESRQDRSRHPVGKFDSAGRWLPSADERRDCCDSVRQPSRSYPYSLNKHCRSVEHVAALYGVSVSDLRKAARKTRPAQRAGGDNYYKAVALTSDGRMVSIYDGSTEYKIGEMRKEAARTGHGGGIYVYQSIKEAVNAEVPQRSKAIDCRRVVLRCRCEGSYTRYDSGKIAFGRVTPLEVVRGVVAVKISRGNCIWCGMEKYEWHWLGNDKHDHAVEGHRDYCRVPMEFGEHEINERAMVS